MFTGIIQAVGTVVSMQPTGGDLRLRIETGQLSLDDVALGDSICTSGVCLTVIELPGDGYWADVSVETLDFTTLGALQPGSRVNLEKALTPASRLGGHIVSGHVDGVGEVKTIQKKGNFWEMLFTAPQELLSEMVVKGSVAVDGISLTVVDIKDNSFSVSLIPETLERTTLGRAKIGQKVNIETDVIVKAVKRQLEQMLGKKKLTLENLQEMGY